MSSMVLRSGINPAAEAEANKWLRQSREGVTKLSEKKDFLTEDQLTLRWEREIPNGTGYAEAHIASGMYKRSYNPLAGKRPSRARAHDDG